MKRNTLFSFLTVAALGLLIAGPASAANSTWQGDESASYNDPDNWSNGVPGSGDTATINAVTAPDLDPVLSRDDRSLGRLLMGNGAKLTITGRTLTLDGRTPHDIDGEIHLTSSGSVLKVTADVTMDITGKIVLEVANADLDLDADVTVQGTGQIEGQADAAEVQIAAGKVLTSTMSIVGNMKIVGETGGTAGKLDNRGAVLANALNGILELGSNLLLADTAGSGRWEASVRDTAVLLFSNAHTCALLGDFRLGDCATIQFDVDIDTQGSLLHDATNNTGTIDVNAGASFGYDCDSADPCDCTYIVEDTTLGCS